MDLWVLDPNFEQVLYVDKYESLIWTDRYGAYGDTELVIPISNSVLEYIRNDYYLYLPQSEHMMVINTISISSDSEEGTKLTAKGYSLESILSRRIVWGQRSYSGDLQTVIKTMVDEAIISPTNPKRKIENFIFVPTTDKAVTDISINATDYTGDNLYTVIKNLCSVYSLGMKLVYDFSEKKLKFSIYAGKDRSFDQAVNPYVRFSPSNENLLNSEYESSTANTVNTVLVQGSDFDPAASMVKGKTVETKDTQKTTSGDIETTTTWTTTVVYSNTGAQMSKTHVVDVSNKNNSTGSTWKTTTTTEYDVSGNEISKKVDYDETTKYGSDDDPNRWERNISRVKETAPDKTTDQETHKETRHSPVNSDTERVVTTTTIVKDNRTDTKTTGIQVEYGDATGLSRREGYVDGQSSSTTTDQNAPLTFEAYKSALTEKGKLEVESKSSYSTYEGETDPKVMYVYGVDYEIGDIVQIENEHGFRGKSRITEMIFSQSTGKVSVLPTFVSV